MRSTTNLLKSASVIWFILLLILISQSVWAVNLLANPGFEDGVPYDNQSAGQTYTAAGWTYHTDSLSSGFWNGAETAWGGGTRVRNGAISVRVFHYGPIYGYPEGWRTATISQTVDALPNQNYTASAWAFIYLEPGNNIGNEFSAGIKVEEFNSSGTVLATHQSYFADASSNWRQLTVSFKSKGTTARLRYTLTNHWLLTEELNHINWDDCALEGPSPHVKTLQGTIKSGANPLSGASITAAGLSTTSDGSGFYSFELPVTTSSVMLRVKKDGHYTQRKYRNLGVGVTTVDFDLTAIGDNLVANAGFDDDPYVGWTEETSGAGNCLRRGELTFIRDGVGLPPYYVSGEEAVCFLLDPANPSGLWYNQSVPVVGGGQYTARVKTRVSMASGAASIWGNTTDQQIAGLLVKEYDADGSLVLAHPLVKSSELSSWQQLTYTFTTSLNTKSVKVGPYAWMIEGSRYNGWWRRVTFDDVELKGQLGSYGLSGTVKSGDSPVSGAVVEISEEDGPTYTCITDSNGYYEAAVSYRSLCTISVNTPGYYPQTKTSTITGTMKVDFDLFAVGDNLLYNPGFDEPTGWLSGGWMVEGTGNVAPETNFGLFGPTHMISYPQAAAISGWSDHWGRIFQEVPVKPGAVYTAGVRFLACTDARYGSQWGVDPRQKAGLFVRQLDSQRQPIGSEQIVYADVTLENRDQWKSLSLQITTAQNAMYVQVGGYANLVDNRDSNLARAIFDNFEFNGPPAAVALRSIRTFADGSSVFISGGVVTAKYKGFCYIENPDRSAGIRLNQEINPGEVLDVSGTVVTVNGEKSVDAGMIIRRAVTDIPGSLGMNISAIKLGLSPIGLYIRTWGKVASVDWAKGISYLDDGGGNSLKVYGKVPLGELVQVTGALGCEASANGTIPVLRAVQATVYGSGSGTTRTGLKAGFVLDDQCRVQANQDGRNYWWNYIVEILDRLGLDADQITPAELPSRLNDYSILFLASHEEALLFSAWGTGFESALDEWVRSGGLLIASRTEGLDRLMGNQFQRIIPQTNDFTCSGEFYLREGNFTWDIHSPLHPDDPLLAFGPVRIVTPVSSQVIAENGQDVYVTARQYGEGWAYYFGFDLGQTFWVIQQGRPVYADYDGDGHLRSGDAIAIGNHEPEIGYTDELMFLLQNMISVRPHPLIHQLPAMGNTVPDAMFFYGGDDECGTGIQVQAATFMNSRGLPYHINCMPYGGSFGLTPADIAQCDALGTDLSIHYNFVDGFLPGSGYTQADVDYQSQLFINHFGRVPVCSVNHWVRWVGWEEPARWMMEAGLKGDNGRIHIPLTTPNPINQIGFSFGTSFPSYFWSSHTTGNQRLNFLELPITGYEIGYNGGLRDFAKIERGLYLSSYYNLIFDFFYHPVYIAAYPACRDAIDYMLYQTHQQGLNILHATPAQVVNWWMDRSDISVSDIEFNNGRLTFRAAKPSPGGFVMKIPLGPYEPLNVPYPHVVKSAFGNQWLMIVLPEGDNQVQIDLKPRAFPMQKIKAKSRRF